VILSDTVIKFNMDGDLDDAIQDVRDRLSRFLLKPEETNQGSHEETNKVTSPPAV
jgi:hypothetical protein